MPTRKVAAYVEAVVTKLIEAKWSTVGDFDATFRTVLMGTELFRDPRKRRGTRLVIAVGPLRWMLLLDWEGRCEDAEVTLYWASSSDEERASEAIPRRAARERFNAARTVLSSLLGRPVAVLKDGPEEETIAWELRAARVNLRFTRQGSEPFFGVDLLVSPGTVVEQTRKESTLSLRPTSRMRLDDFAEMVRSRSPSEVDDVISAQPSLLTRASAQGVTPLHVAMAHGHPDIAELLIRRGASVHARTGEGLTPLHLVRFPGDVELLVSRGADVEARCAIGRTPLRFQVETTPKDGSLVVIEELLRAGADVLAKATDGRSALDVAVGRRELKMMRALQSGLVRQKV